MKASGAINGVLTICLTIVGSAIALGGLVLVGQSNLRADLRAEIAINRAEIVEVRSEVGGIRRDLGDLRADVARIEGSLLATDSGALTPNSNPLSQ